jgi:ATP synthase protein I
MSADPQNTAQTLAGAGKSSNAAISLLANVIVGGLMGYGIDVLAGTLPLFMIVMLFLGFAAGLRTVWKQLNAKPPADDRPA